MKGKHEQKNQKWVSSQGWTRIWVSTTFDKSQKHFLSSSFFFSDKKVKKNMVIKSKKSEYCNKIIFTSLRVSTAPKELVKKLKIIIKGDP